MSESQPKGAPIQADPAYLSLHLTEPDYEKPRLEVPAEQRRGILDTLGILYGEEEAAQTYPELERLMKVYYAHKTEQMIADDLIFDPRNRFTEKDVLLITYGDLILTADKSPLEVLGDMLQQHVANITTIHILPFFPFSSDRGFSVIDYEQVDPRLGDWEDVEQLGQRFGLMFDGVINHVSAKSRWFQEFLNGNPEYRDFFITFSTREAVSEDHMKLILRPRASDLLSPFETLDGRRYVWTTFSRDQIDLNFRNPRVLLKVVEVLLTYARHGADLIRLDAATYLWRELGTSCAHLRRTHALIQLFRQVLDVVAPRVALVSETNVPHEDNITYFGDGINEAQMVYNFALPPLVLLTFQTGDSGHLTRWAAGLERISDRATFFNFLDSHDGIGQLPIQDLVPADERMAIVERAKEHGAKVSYRTDQNGEKTPYELNVTWWSALNRPDSGEPLDLKVARFVASRSIALVLAGVPGIYIASMVGARNDLKAIALGAENRSINRRGIKAKRLEVLLADGESRASRCFHGINRLLDVRVRTPAFHPNGEQRVLTLDPGVFAVVRWAPEDDSPLLALTSVVSEPQRVVVRRSDLEPGWGERWMDLLSQREIGATDEELVFDLDPYEVSWWIRK
jgi:glycosidase